MDALIERSSKYHDESVALVQLLSADQGIIYTGLGTLVHRASSPPPALLQLLQHLAQRGRLRDPECVALAQQLIQRLGGELYPET